MAAKIVYFAEEKELKEEKKKLGWTCKYCKFNNYLAVEGEAKNSLPLAFEACLSCHKPRSTRWMCENDKCRKINRDRRTCESCGFINQLVEKQVVKRNDDDTWDCPLCVYRNEGYKTVCTFCKCDEKEMHLEKSGKIYSIPDYSTPMPQDVNILPRKYVPSQYYSPFKSIISSVESASTYKSMIRDVEASKIEAPPGWRNVDGAYWEKKGEDNCLRQPIYMDADKLRNLPVIRVTG